jgi:hypothetical protein
MAATVGELVVNLTARTGAFNRGLDSAGRKTGRFGSKLRSVTPTIAKFGAAIAGFIAVRRLAGWFREGIEQIDRMAKVSRKLGTTVEQLNALHFAGKKAGIGVNTIDMALQRMTRRVAEAAIGTGEAKAAIAELGLDPAKLSAAGPYESLLKIGDALKQIESPAQRVRLAFKLFDSEGVEMVNILSEGSAGLEEAKRKMDALAGSTSLGAKNVEALTDKLTEFGSVLTEGGRNRLIEALAGLGAQVGLWGEPITGENIARRLRKEANSREKQRLYEESLARAAAEEAAEKKRRANAIAALRERGRDLAARMTNARNLIAQQIRGDDGGSLQLPGAFGAGSAQAYSTMVRSRMQKTGKKTEEEILATVRKQLDEERKQNKKLDRMLQKLDIGAMEMF